ncbi:MAG TPA: dockerin type I domain-containing protein [Ignavibacteriaceae bacterium]|nr:dockerin type I domain-containing protein [Ignavibacteriaceae bacterium]
MFKTLYFVLLFNVIIFSQAIIYIDPQTQTSGDQDIIVNVKVLDVIELFGYSISVNFNSNIVSYVNATQGTFLQNSSFFITAPSIANPNILKIDHVVLGGTGYSGSGLLFKVTFRPKNSGSSILNLINVELRKTNNTGTIPYEVSNGNIIVPLCLDTKIFLEGAFNSQTSLMNTTLNSNGWLPKSQPFSAAPFDYNGTERVADNFYINNQNIVDWILVELININDSSVLSRRAGFLLKNGTIVDVDGSSKIKFNLDYGTYYLKVYARGYLPVISKVPLALNKSTTLYDFSLIKYQAKGINPQKQLTTTLFGLYVGDLNNDFHITSSDFNKYLLLKFQNSSNYNYADFNFDGYVDELDYQLLYNNLMNLIGETITF